jgi:hypothetical protein
VPAFVAAEVGVEGVRRVLRRKAALRRTRMSESESGGKFWDGLSMSGWTRWVMRGFFLPEKASRSASHPPAASNRAIAAALCFRRPERVYIALERSCWDEGAKGERWDRMVGRGSMARYYDARVLRGCSGCV